MRVKASYRGEAQELWKKLSDAADFLRALREGGDDEAIDLLVDHGEDVLSGIEAALIGLGHVNVDGR